MTMDYEKLQAMSLYLIGLALLQRNQRTHVNHEIMNVIEQINARLETK